MKLTNTQLNVLVRTVWSKIEDKIESLVKTPEYAVALTKAKSDMKYDEKASFIKKQDSIIAKMKKLRDAEDELQREYTKKFIEGGSYWGNPIPKNTKILDTQVEDIAVRIISKDLPTKQDLESDIVLAAMAPGATDIISALTTKYSL